MSDDKKNQSNPVDQQALQDHIADQRPYQDQLQCQGEAQKNPAGTEDQAKAEPTPSEEKSGYKDFHLYSELYINRGKKRGFLDLRKACQTCKQHPLGPGFGIKAEDWERLSAEQQVRYLAWWGDPKLSGPLDPAAKLSHDDFSIRGEFKLSHNPSHLAWWGTHAHPPRPLNINSRDLANLLGIDFYNDTPDSVDVAKAFRDLHGEGIVADASSPNPETDLDKYYKEKVLPELKAKIDAGMGLFPSSTDTENSPVKYGYQEFKTVLEKMEKETEEGMGQSTKLELNAANAVHLTSNEMDAYIAKEFDFGDIEIKYDPIAIWQMVVTLCFRELKNFISKGIVRTTQIAVLMKWASLSCSEHPIYEAASDICEAIEAIQKRIRLVNMALASCKPDEFSFPVADLMYLTNIHYHYVNALVRRLEYLVAPKTLPGMLEKKVLGTKEELREILNKAKKVESEAVGGDLIDFNTFVHNSPYGDCTKTESEFFSKLASGRKSPKA